MSDRQRFQLPAGFYTMVACLAAAAFVVLAEMQTGMPTTVAAVVLLWILLGQPLTVYGLLQHAEAQAGRRGKRVRVLLGALGAPILIAIASVALLSASVWSLGGVGGFLPPTSIIVGIFVYQLVALRALAARHQPWSPAEPTLLTPKLADGPQRAGLIGRAAAAGVELSDVRVERGVVVPDVTVAGGDRPIALISEAASEQLDASTREAMLVLALMRRRWHAPIVVALLCLVPLGIYAGLEHAMAWSWGTALVVALVPFVYLGAIVRRLLDVVTLRAAERVCASDELIKAVDAMRSAKRPGLWAGAFLDLWEGDAVSALMQARWRRRNGQESASSLLSLVVCAVSAVGAILIPTIVLWLPWGVPDLEPRPALVGGSIVALLPMVSWRLLRASGLRPPLDAVRMLVTAPPTWLAYLTLLVTAATYCASAPEVPVLPLSFLAVGVLLSMALLPVVRKMFREDEL